MCWNNTGNEVICYCIIFHFQVSHSSHSWPQFRCASSTVSKLWQFGKDYKSKQRHHLRWRCHVRSSTLGTRRLSKTQLQQSSDQGRGVTTSSGLRRHTVRDKQSWILDVPLPQRCTYDGRNGRRLQGWSAKVPTSADRIPDVFRIRLSDMCFSYKGSYHWTCESGEI